MTFNGPENEELALDTRLLSDFIFELNISRWRVTSYPPEHPLIQASMKKVINVLARLLEFREEIALGVARDALIFEQKFLDQKNPVYREFAKILFNHGIAALIFQKNLEEEELLRFNQILRQKWETIRENGGIKQTIDNAGFQHLQVKTVNYDLFRVVENDQIEINGGDQKSSPVWEHFVRNLLDGTLDPSGTAGEVPQETDPALLARIMNEQLWKDPRSKELSYDHVMASYIRGVFGYEHESERRKAYLDRLGKFVTNLNPELRSRFLTDTFRSLPADEEIAEEVLSPFPEEIILETLENMNSRNLFPSPFILKLVKKLAVHGRMAAIGSKMEFSEIKDTGPELTGKLSDVFREDDIETPVPRSYQGLLDSIIAVEKISGPEFEEFGVLKKSLDGHCVNIQISAIILELFKSGPTPDYLGALKQNLVDSCGYFLGTGDFQTLNQLHSQLVDIGSSALGPGDSPATEVLSAFEKPEFMEEILTGIQLWEKKKYPDIKKLIRKIGNSFISPVLDHLADEPSRSIRHFYIHLLSEMGDVVRVPALSRLEDQRWYFLRNLILILRHLSDASILPAVRKLIPHPHPRVREEALKALFHFQDPDAERMLLQDLSSEEKEIQRGAVQVAAESRRPEIFNKLVEILNRRGVLDADSDLKIKVIHALARIGNPESLPHLERLLRSRNRLFGQTMNLLKAEVIRSLEFYPAGAAGPLLEKFSRANDKDLANLASRKLRSMRARNVS